MRFDPDKILTVIFYPYLKKTCLVPLIFYFMLPVFSDKIALKLGYPYFCPKPVETTYFEHYLFYDFTYAEQPDLCPSTEAENH
jgi:hypothetical protein